MRKLFNLLNRWLERLLRIDVYSCSETEIIKSRGLWADDRFPIAAVQSWRVYPEMVFDMVVITFGDGELVWHDKYNDLIEILKRVLSEKQIYD